jgi:hypothetical protein
MSGAVIVSAVVGLGLVGAVFWLLDQHRKRLGRRIREVSDELAHSKTSYETSHQNAVWKVSQKRFDRFFSQWPGPPPPVPKPPQRETHSAGDTRPAAPQPPRFGHRRANSYQPGQRH